MQITKPQILLITGVILLIVIVVVVAYGLLSYYASSNPALDSKQTWQTEPTIDPNPFEEAQQKQREQQEIQKHIAEVDEHHQTEEYKTDSGIYDAVITSVNDVSVVQKYVPVPANPKDTAEKRYSTDNEHYAQIQGTSVLITETKSGTIVWSIPITQQTAEIQIVWLTNKLLLLVEKEQEDLQVDKLFILNLPKQTKTFTVGSFPVASRFNLAKIPQVFDAGSRVIFYDNDEELWEVTISLRP